MKLTKEDIQFIDTYLENSDIVFADIRMEMVDHVASGIEAQIEAGDERDFYDVFKDYMIENKARLLKNNKKFIKSADKKILKAFLKEFVRPLTLLLFIVSSVGFYFLYKISNIEIFRLFVSIVPLLGLTGFILTYMVYNRVKNYKRFSVVERLAFPFLAFYQLPNIFINWTKQINDTGDLFWLIGGVSLALTLLLVLISVSLKLFQSYERQYKALA